MINAAEMIRVKSLQYEQEEQRRLEAERQREQMEWQRRLEEERHRNSRRIAALWVRSQNMRSFLQECERSLSANSYSFLDLLVGLVEKTIVANVNSSSRLAKSGFFNWRVTDFAISVRGRSFMASHQ
jgi:hypothetical protein